MTVSQLMVALSAFDPRAEVVIHTTPLAKFHVGHVSRSLVAGRVVIQADLPTQHGPGASS